MQEKNNYLSKDCTPEDFPKIDLEFGESKEEVWSKIESKLDSRKIPLKSKLPTSFYVISIAATLLFLIGMMTFFRFYTKTLYCPAGQHLTVELPDHSEVILNAESIIAWHPFWMKFDRGVKLEGEAYFHVKKGTGFKVISTNGETKVLGTTFNVYSREEDYRVSCFSGSVHISSPTGNQTAILKPGDQGMIQKNGMIQLLQSRNLESSKSWIDNMFVFTGASLNSVIQEIERQYNITITLKENNPLSYTGNFNKSISAKEVLSLICTSLDLKFEAKSDNEYLIYKD
jgi:ferric-dicitrate binding protein FerR (iron transport regulator)